MLLPTWGAPAENRTWRVDGPTSRGESAVGGVPPIPHAASLHTAAVFLPPTSMSFFVY